MKGDDGKNLQGIGLGFTNGFMSPICEPEAYSSFVTQAFAYDVDLEEPYNQIYVKVAKQSANDTIITGIRFGGLGTYALHHEWRKLGEWQGPHQIDHNEKIIGVRGCFNTGGSIKSIGFLLMSNDI